MQGQPEPNLSCFERHSLRKGVGRKNSDSVILESSVQVSVTFAGCDSYQRPRSTHSLSSETKILPPWVFQF